MCKLQDKGWQLGLRFDPLIYQRDYQQQYKRLFAQIFSRVNIEGLHSVSLGVFRLPEKYFKKIHNLYPQEKLFAGPLEKSQGMVSYRDELEQEMMHTCTDMLLDYIPEAKLFPCQL